MNFQITFEFSMFSFVVKESLPTIDHVLFIKIMLKLENHVLLNVFIFTFSEKLTLRCFHRN